MAERRMITKSISVSEQVNTLATDFARLLFTWMIPHADDYGVLFGSAWRVRALVIPMLDHTNAEVEAALVDMETHELIWRYVGDDGVQYIQFRTWETHQSGLHKRTKPHQPLHFDPRSERSETKAQSQEKPGTDVQDDNSGTGFPEVPGSSRKFPASRARAEGEGEGKEKGTEGEGKRDVRDVVVKPPSSADSADSADLVSFCTRVASRTKLPNRPDVLEQLSAVIASHLARGLSQADIWRDVLNLTDPTRDKYTAKPSVSQISNWLAHAHRSADLAASNGHNGHARASPRREPPAFRTADQVKPVGW